MFSENNQGKQKWNNLTVMDNTKSHTKIEYHVHSNLRGQVSYIISVLSKI